MSAMNLYAHFNSLRFNVVQCTHLYVPVFTQLWIILVLVSSYTWRIVERTRVFLQEWTSSATTIHTPTDHILSQRCGTPEVSLKFSDFTTVFLCTAVHAIISFWSDTCFFSLSIYSLAGHPALSMPIL